MTALDDEFRALCASGDSAVKHVSADLNGDGDKDSLCWWAVATPFGDYVQLLPSVGTKELYAVLPARSGQTVGLCSISTVYVTVIRWDSAYNGQFGLDKSPGKIAIQVADDVCDKAYLFWQDQGRGENLILLSCGSSLPARRQ